MTIRDRIFDKIEEIGLTQKKFSKRTGIPESTVSDWRKKKTNPTAYNSMDKSRKARLLGYAEALMNHYGKRTCSQSLIFF